MRTVLNLEGLEHRAKALVVVVALLAAQLKRGQAAVDAGEVAADGRLEMGAGTNGRGPYNVYVHGSPEYVDQHQLLALPGRYIKTIFFELPTQQVLPAASDSHFASLPTRCALCKPCVVRR